MIEITQIYRTIKKDALARVAEEEITRLIKPEQTEDEEDYIERLIKGDSYKPKPKIDTNIELDLEEGDFKPEDFKYTTMRAAIDPACIENIFELSWCVTIEKASGDIVQVQHSFEEILEKINKHKKNN